MQGRLVWVCALAFVLLAPVARAETDIDSDGDGLSDFQETHKYLTDPAKADSDGDGTLDGAWDERREFAYTVRSVVRVMRPVSPDLDDDYQDARVLESTPTWVKLEVVHYPLNTVADALHGDPEWRTTASHMKADTGPGRTSNFDAAMSNALAKLLKADGIDVAALDDKTLVERAARWLCSHAKYEKDQFTGYFTHFPDGNAAVHPDCEKGISNYNRAGRSEEEQWARDLFAKQMFENRARGSCTSSAIYLNGCLRAIGIPTRIVYCIPVIDASDPSEVAMLGSLRHPAVRATLTRTLEGMDGWNGHTFNEVFVGGRWRRLNYFALGENTYGRHVFGLLTHVLTVGDWSEADVASTIGVRQANGRYDDVFGHRNPYSTVELSDRFGIHMKRPKELEPAERGPSLAAARVLADPEWSDAPDSLGRAYELDRLSVLARVRDYDGDFEALKAHQAGGESTVWLEAEGLDSIRLAMVTGGITQQGSAWVVLYVPDPGRLREGVRYRLRAEAPTRWTVDGDLPLRQK